MADRLISRLAARQHGVVARWQLIEAGVSARQIKRRLDAHSGRGAFQRDRLRVAKLRAAGVSTMPVTGRQIQRDPDGVVARLLAALRDAA